MTIYPLGNPLAAALSVPCCTHRSPSMSPATQFLASELKQFSNSTQFCLILILYLLPLIATAHIL